VDFPVSRLELAAAAQHNMCIMDARVWLLLLLLLLLELVMVLQWLRLLLWGGLCS